MSKAGLYKETVLKAAARLADEKGLDALSMKLLAGELGVQPPSLYNHIESLDELKRELMLYGWRELEQRLLRSAVGVGGWEAFRAMCREFYRFAVENRGVFNAMLWYNKYSDSDSMSATGELFDKALKFKIYDFLDWQTERPVMLQKWRDFAAGADGTYVFNCVLMQNPMCETMMRFGMTTEQSLGFIREICAEIQPLDPVVIYLKSTDPAALVKAALPERGNDWLNAVIDYHCNGAYGRSAGLNGFDGYIAALRERQRRELEMLPKLPVKYTILDDPQSDWERVYRKIGEFLDQD